MNTVTAKQLNGFLVRYQRKQWPDLRLGQAFLTDLLPHVTDNKLFYETSERLCINQIWDKYLNG